MITFAELGLEPALLNALLAGGYTEPTPIQAQTIPLTMQGRDVLGLAQTGTGKTAAFSLPLLNKILKDRKAPQKGRCRALILSPTRELANQIVQKIRSYAGTSRVTTAVIFGGMPMPPQTRALQAGVDVIVATPGRLLDHMKQGNLRLDAVEIVVVDEADHMMDIGFLQPLKQIANALPKQRQSMFFSATMPKEIRNLADQFLRDPVEIAVARQSTPIAAIDQQVFFIEAGSKRALLLELLKNEDITRTIVFSRTKHGADRIVRTLEAANIRSEALHGNRSQAQRTRALASFKQGQTRVLVATDIAARGIHVDAVSHVINFDLPNIAESYIHRIGRTARAGSTGVAISFCDGEERAFLKDIEKLIGKSLPATDRRRENMAKPVEAEVVKPQGRDGGRGGRGGGRDAGRGGREGGRSGERPEGRGKSTWSASERADRTDRPSERTKYRPERGPDDRTAASERPASSRPFGDRRPSEPRSSEPRKFEPRGDAAKRPYTPRHDTPQPEGARTDGGRPEGERHHHRRGNAPAGGLKEGRPRSAEGERGARPDGAARPPFKGAKPYKGKPAFGEQRSGGKPEGAASGKRPFRSNKPKAA